MEMLLAAVGFTYSFSVADFRPTDKQRPAKSHPPSPYPLPTLHSNPLSSLLPSVMVGKVENNSTKNLIDDRNNSTANRKDGKLYQARVGKRDEADRKGIASVSISPPPPPPSLPSDRLSAKDIETPSNPLPVPSPATPLRGRVSSHTQSSVVIKAGADAIERGERDWSRVAGGSRGSRSVGHGRSNTARGKQREESGRGLQRALFEAEEQMGGTTDSPDKFNI
jgi:hypothetical protein